MSENSKKVRLDKWLWAARFFKTRSMAKQAIEGGKVHFDGSRCKVSKEVVVGSELTIRQGQDVKTVLVEQLSQQRRGYEIAKELYRETDDSLAKRALNSEQRRQLNAGMVHTERRPNKRDRRLIHGFKDAMRQEQE